MTVNTICTSGIHETNIFPNITVGGYFSNRNENGNIKTWNAVILERLK